MTEPNFLKLPPRKKCRHYQIYPEKILDTVITTAHMRILPNKLTNQKLSSLRRVKSQLIQKIHRQQDTPEGVGKFVHQKDFHSKVLKGTSKTKKGDVEVSPLHK